MTTPRIRSLVSLAAVISLSAVLGGCASTPSRIAAAAASPLDESPTAIRFDNEARDYVHVYLIGMRREWMLGRVAPGARASLRIPLAALAEDAGTMRLAVLVGQRMTLRASTDARAEVTIPASVQGILTQRWTFSPLLSRGVQLMGSPMSRR